MSDADLLQVLPRHWHCEAMPQVRPIFPGSAAELYVGCSNTKVDENGLSTPHRIAGGIR